ncbi:MAG TPA: divalent-cation tolerance protein CutA [Ktedonobacteraceae bacterium]|nr:divalent-cation tolerance protein CutA [Ktedonobacteraceae bacterium]
MTEFMQVTVAINSEEGAHTLAETLIAKRLAASCWVSGPITSTYWWKGKTEQATEWVCTIKTRSALYGDVEQTIKETHPYEVPGILASPVIAGSQAYLNWLKQETGARTHNRAEGRTKEQLLQEMIEAQERLITAATNAQARGVVRQGDTWGPREILAHIAGWEAHAVARIPRIIAGMPPLTYIHDAQHAAADDAVNAAIITVLGDQSFDTVRDILRKTYQRDIQMLRELGDTFFTPGNYVYERIKAAIDHINQHAFELEEQQSS